MLDNFRKGVCALAVATTSMATSAQADNQSVLIMDGGYFPAIIYVRPGDNIIFTNHSEADHTLAGPDESWASDPIAFESTYVLNIHHQLPQTFSGIGPDGELMEGSFSFDPAPLTE